MIHQYKLGGYNIVLDVCSGSVHAVDEVAYDIIGMFDGFVPKHTRRYAETGNVITTALASYADDVRNGRFPGPEHSF